MPAATALASAKVNLYLHVGRARADGRHPLDSLVVFAGREAADTLSAEIADLDNLLVHGPTGDQTGPADDNLIIRALERLRGQVRLDPERGRRVAFVLHKCLPVAAGIGGGSADAGAALRLLVNDVFELPERVMLDIAPQLGGDVLACARNRPCLMRGDGDQVETAMPFDTARLMNRSAGGGLPAVLVNPGLACPTGPVFARFDALGGGLGFGEIAPPDVDRRYDLIRWLATDTRNDLEGPAIDLVPEIGAVLERLDALQGAQLTRMSGSGATCFALFLNMDDALLAQAELMREHPNWWVRATLLGEGA